MSFYYLECPYFSDRDQVSSMGALYDGYSNNWYVPSSLYPVIQSFNHWRPDGKVFLYCSYEERHDAKRAGAKWDPTVKAWYLYCRKGAVIPPQFTPWLQTDDDYYANDAPYYEDCFDGFANDFDCNKNGHARHELINVHASSKSSSNARSYKKTSRTHSERTNNPYFDENVAPVPSSKSNRYASNAAKAKTNRTTAASKISYSTKKTVSGAKVNWSSFPCITSDLTVAQLTHELLHRHPLLKGTSSKPKIWFLHQLGQHSIWTTAPDLNHKERLTISSQPVVTSQLTVAQLKHELMTRGCPKYSINKPKAELMNLVGEGSVWTTAPETAPKEKQTKKQKPAAGTNSNRSKQRSSKADTQIVINING